MITHDGQVVHAGDRALLVPTYEPELTGQSAAMGRRHSSADLTIFVLALLVGFEVISKVPATLHTPLMSGANSIHGVVLVGVVLLSSFVAGPVGYILTFVAAAFAAANVVGGYVVTDRMLRMFRRAPGAASPRTDVTASELGTLSDRSGRAR